MENLEKRYSNGEITVLWKPDSCIHSTLCWKGLISVFNPRNRPWVNMEGADTETIKQQIEKCPSGALSWVSAKEEETVAEVSTDTVVEVMPNGPLLVYGNLSVKNQEGEEKKSHKVTAFCRCGASSNKPYCDGSHVRIGFEG